MNLLVPIDVWQEETNAHLGQDLGRMLPLAQATSLCWSMLCKTSPILKRLLLENITPIIFAVNWKRREVDLQDLAKELKPHCSSVESIFEHGLPAKIIR